MSEKALNTNLNIPTKTLQDNFKLNDFQKDFTDLLALSLSATSKPIRIEFTNMSTMEVFYDDGRFVQYRFERTGTQITKILNLTDNREIIIKW